MYNLLMVYKEGTWDEEEFVLELPRFLEHTAQPLIDRFGSLDQSVIQALKSMPTLFAYEDRGREVGLPARVGSIEDIQVRYGGLRITWSFDAGVAPIPAGTLREMFGQLDIADRNWEHTRTHWAVKDVDLYDVLLRHGLLEDDSTQPPKVFVSYSWDSQEHIDWVGRLVRDLRASGIDAISDRTHLRLGQNLPHFMEQTAACERVIVVCTENYMNRADERVGGVGYEHLVTASELANDALSMKFIPVIRDPRDAVHMPANLRGRMYVDLSYGPRYNSNFQDLVRDLHNAVPPVPPIGRRPHFQ
ncbi:toll/interleukin-1 receptor domain-containing protein [Xanthomonas campestris pv. campestris]|nr:toll/interleukin-1 receptor domain-containing protein [Xanthomonas campestris pv. campestris]